MRIERQDGNIKVSISEKNMFYFAASVGIIIAVLIIGSSLSKIFSKLNESHQAECKRLVEYCIKRNSSNKKYIQDVLADGEIDCQEFHALSRFEKAEKARISYGVSN